MTLESLHRCYLLYIMLATIILISSGESVPRGSFKLSSVP